MRLLINLAVAAFFVFCGWIGGTLYPAPEAITGAIQQRAVMAARLRGLDLTRLRALVGDRQFAAIRQEASQAAARAGQAIVIEHVEDAEHVDAETPSPAETGAPGPAGRPGSFDTDLLLCPRMTVSNAPAAGANRQVNAYARIVNVNGVALAIDPTHGACLSSGFGDRNGRLHKGLDFHAADGGPIMAGADGVVIERKYRDDYGNMLLIDHGHGVYTRYAHLSSFASGIVEGAHVSAGQQIGLMGNTAGYQIPIHLHYELLLGDYANSRGSFGLTPHSPFEYPRQT